MEFLVGLDIGTSSVKGVLMSRDGKVENVKTKKHAYYWENNLKLLNADAFCDNCFSVIKELSDSLKDGDEIAEIIQESFRLFLQKELLALAIEPRV